MELSKYVFVTDSYNGEYKILFNSKNGFFIKYPNSDFKNINDFITNKKISDFLEEKLFFKTENETEEIKMIHKNVLKSDDTLQLIIKITKDCNFRCTYCYENFDAINMGVEEKNAILKFIIRKYKENNFKNLIIIFFGGEPLLNIDFIESLSKDIINFSNLNNINYSSSVVTNGYNLNENNFNRLVNYVNTYQITIDGGSKLHDSQRLLKNGSGTFDKIINNLKYIKSTGYKYKIILRSNISKTMLGNMEGYYKDISEFFDDKRFIAMFHPVVHFSDLSHDVTDRDVLEEMKIANNYNIRFARLSSYLTLDTSFCYAIKDNHYSINSDMSVARCTDVNDEFSIVGKLNYDGKIEFNKFNNIWKAARFSEKCVGCHMYAGCGGGACPLFYLKHGQARCSKYKGIVCIDEVLKFDEMTNKHDLCIRGKI